MKAALKTRKKEEGGKEGYKGMYIGRQKGKLSANINKNVIEVYNSFEILLLLFILCYPNHRIPKLFYVIIEIL